MCHMSIIPAFLEQLQDLVCLTASLCTPQLCNSVVNLPFQICEIPLLDYRKKIYLPFVTSVGRNGK